MDLRFQWLLASASILSFVLPCTANAQTTTADATHDRAWSAPLTPDGQPNLQGDWTNDTYTPLERPAALGDKAFYTEEEAAAFIKSRIDRLNGQAANDIHYDDAIWQAEKYDKVVDRRTSLIVEPKNGRLPPLTEQGEARLKQQRATQRANPVAAGAPSRSLAERCISWGNVGPPMMPPTYNANMQIIQAKDVVILLHEMMHDTRFIYLDGRAHPPASVQWLAGHSVGRWEGQTLVVDTTNFTPTTNFRGSPANTRQDIFATEHMHVVERFTPTDEHAIHYAFTVEDPATWTTAWSGAMDMRRVDGPIYEYACHEGNYGLANILRATQLARK
ncbi:MAG: hypothetical protein ABI640_11610 [Gammaproteobacteria bacterium]